ncbi:single-stranded-DNA-specific exonuclease RecJ [Jeotgalibacillus sp. S-D1]|uniref:single-stranded-DNA-specific exonuclease RecJ n=1 Tax=Jeotgalibacillus sp. S-D1 TaxID=2552189 RepID=UPI0010593B91|nr:single-stranded-DNA-specific exonuclease RecJ [Jeotgalibacillus sp. S-D1]TDL34439.1 single-stranded-DNA-specific exonuclease RecJ [Jeotgalibacillus sp. S-D1]
MLPSKTRWEINSIDKEQVQALTKALEIPDVVARLLVQRGLTDIEEARSFLYIEKQSFYDPFLFLGMDIAVARIKRAIENEEMIMVYGDYDADGVTSTSVLMTALQQMEANVEFYIPNRFTEGYGPNEEAFRFAAEQGISLIITVDNGISGVHEANVLKELGVDLIITDHHEPGPILPEALAIIHPNHPDGKYPFRELAGVGVAFKLAHALLGKAPVHLLDLVAIGTIADLVALRDENRLMVKQGLQVLRQTSRKGILALCRVAGAAISDLDEESVGFVIGPRLNAVGRLSDADPAVDLIMTENSGEAESLAVEIDTMNKERKSIVSEITEQAIKQVEENYSLEENRVLVIAKEGWNPGVVGIVASRLVDRYYRPVIILCLDPITGKAKGSARSIAGFNMFEELSQNRDILPQFGGHPMAAGMTLSLEHVDTLRIRLNEQAKFLAPEDFIPITPVDTMAHLDEIDIHSISKLQMLAPFGMKNPKPKVLIEQSSVASIRKIGANQNHLKITLEKGKSALDGIAFGLGELADHVSPLAKIDVIGELSINEWNNTRKPQIFVKDVKINDWQLFDVRGISQPERWLATLPPQRDVIAFDPKTVHAFSKYLAAESIMVIENEEQASEYSIDQKQIVLLDLPSNEEILLNLIKNGKPVRVYAHFYQDDPQFFNAMPSRDHFAWYYGFLKKRQEFDLSKNGDALANHKGWSRDTINFMSKVFFELDFVTIKDGMITVNKSVEKRDLSHSPAYQTKERMVNLEQELLYSSFQQLKVWFEEHTEWAKRLEEEEKVWI